MNYLLFEPSETRLNLLPLTFTRAVCDVRVGIFTIREKWEKGLRTHVQVLTQAYLQALYGQIDLSKNWVYINGSVCPTADLLSYLRVMDEGSAIVHKGVLVAARPGLGQSFEENAGAYAQQMSYDGHLNIINNPTDIYGLNAAEIRHDFEQYVHENTHGINDKHTVMYGKDNIWTAEGVHIRAAIINAEDGPVYLGKGVQVQEGSMIKGPLAVLEGGVINMGAKMRGDNTVGPYSKVGGEVSNSVIFGYSNKGHDGFLGNSVLGHWCNLGADTNTSNLKNNYRDVAIHNYRTGQMEDTGKLFCGLIMADHSKSGINSMFNTGTVVGVGSNIFGGGFPPKHVHDFSWGGPESGFERHDIERMLATERRVFARRKLELSADYEAVLRHLAAESEARFWQV